MNTSKTDPGDLERELRDLGRNLGDVFRTALASEERQRVQSEIATGLSELAAALKSAADDFAQSEAGSRWARDVRDLESRIQSGELETKVRQDLLEMLRSLNAELQRAGQAMGGGGAWEAPAEEEEG